MSSEASSDQERHEQSGHGPDAVLAERLSYLLKHAQLALSALSSAALAPYGIDGRELGTLIVLAGDEPASQQQAAARLRIDRTTMVALLDALEEKGLVTRRPHASDRRKNVVELTTSGHETLREATRASDEAERRFLAQLGPSDARQLKQWLRALISQERGQ